MKIVHICQGVYTDEMAYQENLLTKYHARNGLKVTVITSTWKLDAGSRLLETDKREYVDQNGVHIIRLLIKNDNNVRKKFRRFEGLYESLCMEKPDILFLHGCQYLDVAVITKYICKNGIGSVYIDNHADFSNSATNWVSKNILHKVIWKHYAQMIKPYTTKYYGVLPARVDFLTDIYKLPKEKCTLLMMGADDDLVVNAQKCRGVTRKKYNINENEFLIVTGGKIDRWKWQTVLLEKAVNEMHMKNVKLVIFGSIDKELQEDVMNLCDEYIAYIGWLSVEDTYQLIAASDLAVYPGRHSTLWEQTAGQAIPMIVKHWEGTHHVDMGGNAKFLYNDSCEEMQKALNDLLTNREQYYAMKSAAEKCAGQFLYSNIARESIQV